MPSRVMLILSAVLLSLLMLGVGAQARPAAAPLPEGREPLPPGVTIQSVLDNMRRPVAFVFDPQGRIFYTEKDTGSVRLLINGTLQPTPVITFKVNNLNERGLLGIALDPHFAENHYIYVYYTCGADCPSAENRVVRFVERDGVGADPTTIFTSSVSAPAGNHNGGNIHFGPDGKLYITIGDDATPANSQDLTNKHGKLHRINPDGSVPADNPTFAAPGALPSLYAFGLRNSFDFTFDPLMPGRIFASENGPGCDDEMNRIEPGYNYGWRADYPCDDTAAAGPDPTYNTIAPLWTSGQQCCPAPTGITVYTGDQIPGWRNDVFMGAYQGGHLYHFYLNADRTALTAINTVDGVYAPTAMQTGPDGAFWYLAGGGNTDASLKRIVAAATAASPTAPPAPSATSIPPTAPPAPPVPGSGSRTFPATGQTVSGLFLSYWDTHGGLPQQGYPISPVLREVSDLDGQTYTVQYFERAVFEHHPEHAGTPFEVLLAQLGTYQYRAKYPNGAPDQHASTDNARLFPETGKHLGGKFRAYWESHGGLAQQGYPISEEFTEVDALNGQPYTVQYFERAVFQWHPENAGTPYEVLLAQLGTFRYHGR